MKSKSLVVVGAVAVTCVVAAYVALSRSETSSTIARGAPFLATLSDDAAAVKRIEIDRGGKRIEVAKVGDGWSLLSSGGYPVQFEEVKGLVAGLTALKIDDTMTALAERHDALGLAWPNDSGSGARVRFFSDSAEPTLDLILGEERANPRGQFVRRNGENQCWRVLGSVSVDIDPRRWVDAELIAIPDGEVRGVTFNGLSLRGTEAANGKVTFAAVEAEPLTPASTFEWTEGRTTVALRALPSWLSRLELDDVRKAKGGTPDGAISPTFDMVRGTLTVNAVRDGDAVWISFVAAAKPNAPSADAINATKKYPGDPYIPDWAVFTAKHAGWEYKLPAWKLSSLLEASKLAAEEAAPDLNAPTRVPDPRG